MPELPDITVYVEALAAPVIGEELTRSAARNAILLRTVEPPLSAIVHQRVREVRRSGKRIILGLDDDLFAVFHLMIAGRLHWKPRSNKPPRKTDLAAFEFPNWNADAHRGGHQATSVTASRPRRSGLEEFARGGLEVLEATLDQFAERLRSESHTVKRSLTDPRLFSGIGNAYSDEILHRARLSPVRLTRRSSDEEIATLFEATRTTLVEWTDRLRAEAGEGFPEKVTAFRPEMAVHGKYGQPCPVCGTPVQRIRYADNETNYCARCQTDGKLLADRALSRLLKEDWPRSIDEVI